MLTVLLVDNINDQELIKSTPKGKRSMIEVGHHDPLLAVTLTLLKLLGSRENLFYFAL